MASQSHIFSVCPHRRACQRAGGRSRGLGQRYAVVRIATVADRGDASAGDPRGVVAAVQRRYCQSPQRNFVVYHSALRPFLELPDQAWAEFEASGRIKWASDLAEIPEKFGVTNVYGELGTLS